MKVKELKEYFFSVLVPILGVLVVFLRLTHRINTFWFFGLIFAILGFVRYVSSDTPKIEEQPITDLNEHFNPINKRKKIVVGFFIFLGIFFLFILIFSILGQF